MDIQEYINSGILELYVYGALSEAESIEVTQILNQYPKVEDEVLQIEEALVQLSAGVAPSNPEKLLAALKQKLSKENPSEQTTTIPITRKQTNWPAYIGWAASILLLIGLFTLFQQNNSLRDDLANTQARNAQFEDQIADARESSEKAEELLNVLRDKNVIKVSLAGQAVAPTAYAAAYWNKETNITYIDAKDLPEPPRGMVYQVWSLKLQPLTPTSIGLLENFMEDDNKVFELENINSSEAFGITLEPAGGSKTPTMEQLYTLGAVSS